MNISRLLLVAIFLAGCTRSAELPATETGPQAVAAAVTANVSALSATPPTVNTPTLVPALNGGGVADDEHALPATASAVAITTPLPTAEPSATPTATATIAATATPTAPLWSTDPHPLQIEVMRQQSYPGSPITVEQTLEPGANYSQYVVSYLSDGYRIYALMTVPNGTKPATGWPAIVFNHGYITPAQYRTTERYIAYVDVIARNGYIVFKPDYRGHGSSEGDEVVGGGYGTPGYTADVLNAVASLQAYEDADPNRIGMWGHSMGGHLVLRAMV